MPQSGPRRRRDRAAATEWERRRFLATLVRIVIELAQPLLDHYFGGGPGRLP